MMCALALLAAAWLAGAAGAGATGLGAGAEWCPSLGAGCACGARGARLQCRGAGLRHMPPLHEALLYLDVSHNNISTLPRDALHPATALRDLNLSANRLESVSAGALSAAGAGGNGSSLQRLVLDGCGLRQVPAHALRDMPALLMLSLEDNELSELEAGSLGGVRGVRTLRLAGNRLRRVPGEALAPLAALAVLVLSGNQLTSLSDDALPPLPALHTLLLQRNRITHIEERAFAPTPALVHLRLDDNLLTELPAAVQLLPALRDLSLGRNRVEWVGAEWLRACAALAHLDLRANPLGRLHASALDHLPRLNTLVLSSARALRSLPALAGARALRTVHADRARLTRLPPALCRNAPQLRRLDLKLNQFTRLPDLSQCKELRVLDLSSNSISSLAEAETAAEAEAEPAGEGEGGAGAGGSLAGLARLQDLVLARNLIRRVPRHAFQHTPALQTLNLEDNAIEHIDAEAFVPIRRLEDLNVGGGVFASLPAAGLQHVLHLKAHNNPQLRTFHPPQAFPRVQTLVLSYAYHCCEFLPLMEGGSGSGSGGWPGGVGGGAGGVRDLVLPAPRGADARLWGNDTELIATYANGTAVGVGVGGEWEPSEAELRRALEALAPLPRHVTCLPLPGPFLPCEDLFDWWTLRCGVWAVFLLALLGNGTVVVVLLWSRSRLDVPRFLVTNLAAADLCMGVYLGLLAVVDAATLGEFRAHAVAWQLSGACRLAGFLGVLSAELSVYTLAVITLERNYAITHAMHLNKRLSLRRAGAVMAAGWALALAAAALPLLGVSDYRKFAVCLPFETESPAALGYVAALLAANGLAFLVLLGCYLKMYCAIRGSQAWNSNDSRIARRMALLVFTDFVCWAPVALCALCAAAGARLVSLEQAKVLTVFVLPLNSCCNPFLYAILTKQFKKDCALVCKAIEESRVTRGIGRCRHSSNFSNRQTPANTNSLAERSERAHHGATCACRRLLPAPAPAEPARPTGLRARAGAACRRWARRVLRAPRARARARTPAPPPPGAARAGGGGRARAGSVSSSVEFSSSRSDSWRAGGGAGAGAGAPRPAPARRTAPWLVARKTSQDSNLSSSRNDSSGSNATASTGTWRTSRSGGGAPAGPGQGQGPGPVQTVSSCGGPRPRLTRQPAVSGDEPPLSPPPPPGALWSPPPLAPRLLHTIPSAAEADPPPDELGAR